MKAFYKILASVLTLIWFIIVFVFFFECRAYLYAFNDPITLLFVLLSGLVLTFLSGLGFSFFKSFYYCFTRKNVPVSELQKSKCALIIAIIGGFIGQCISTVTAVIETIGDNYSVSPIGPFTTLNRIGMNIYFILWFCILLPFLGNIFRKIADSR